MKLKRKALIEIAEKYVATFKGIESFAIFKDEIVTFQEGLLFCYQSEKYVNTRNINFLIFGGLPGFIVDGNDGSIFHKLDQPHDPEKLTARNGNITTNISYAMGSGNSVTTEIVFTDAPTQTSINQYDGLGRLTKNILNGVTKNEIEYDNLGRVKKQTYLPGNFTFLEYDDSPLNRVTKEIYPDGSFTEMIHGAESNYIKLKNFDEKGNLTQTLTDFFGQTGQITDAINGITKYDYNNKNLLELVTPPAGSPYSYVYDERNRLIEKSIPGANTQYFDYYDSDDRLKFSLDANGNRLDYEYDDYGREYNVRLNENIDVASGNQGSPGGSIITRSFGESLGGINVGKLIQESAAVFGGPGGMTEATHTYDMFGRVDFTDEKYPLGNGTSEDKIDYTYNHADWLTSEVRDHVGYETMSVGTVYDYDNFGRLIARFKGIQGQGDGLAVGMRYNDRDQMTLKKLGISGVFQSLDKVSYSYSERGWLKKMNDVIAKTTDHTLCQQPNDPQGPVQEEDVVNLEDLLEIFCSGEDVIINDLDPCVDGGCYIEVGDYIATFSLYDNDIDGIVGVYGENNNLIPLNYSYLTDEFTSLETDLANWLEANGYIFDEVKVNYTVNNTNPPTYTGNLSILQTNYNFQSLDYLLKSNNTLTTRFKKQNKKYIPCKNEPGKPIGEDNNQSFAVAQLDAQIATANSSSLSYPTTLYKVLLLDGSIRWVFQEELTLLEGSYTRLDRIYVKDANKNFHVERSDGTTDNLALPQLLAVRPAGDLERVESDENDDPSTECDLTPLGCTPYEQTQQANSIEDIMNAMCNMPIELLSFPIDLHLVQLCDGTTTYVLGDSLVNKIQGPHIILDVTTIDGPDTGINILAVKKERLFAMNFDYEPNGNIEKLKWKVTDNTIKYYQNSYDPLNRITNANYGEELLLEGPNGNLIYTVDPNDIYKAFGFSYDPVGNIEGLSRYGMVPDGNCFTAGLIDQLSYTTDGSTNRLLGVTDNAPSQYRQYGFKPSTHPTSNGIYYEYDDNGNLIVDHHKNLQISYNFLNLPEQVTGGGTVTYTYDALGRKWAKDGTTGKQEYVGSIEYKDGKLDAVYDEDGRVVAEYSGSGLSPTSYRAEYWHKDHLGNTRLAFSDLDHSGHISFSDDPDTPGDDMEIMQENHYYPFGMNQDGPWYETVVPENKYQYNGKELNTDLGLNWNDYGARWYDASIGRWNAVDPLSENFYAWSPYNYVYNNPFLFTDPNGTYPDPPSLFKKAGAYIAGISNSVSSNLVLGAPGTRKNPSEFGDAAEYAAAGQNAGDVLSLAVGAGEMAISILGLTGESLLLAPSGGASSLAMAPTAAIGAHGAGVFGTALNNIINDDGVVHAKGKSSEKVERYMSKEEADQSINNKGLVPGKEPHQNQPKWVAKDGTRNRKKGLNLNKNNTNKTIFEMEVGSLEWLKKFELKSNEPNSFGVPANQIKNFNSKVKKVTTKKLK